MGSEGRDHEGASPSVWAAVDGFAELSGDDDPPQAARSSTNSEIADPCNRLMAPPSPIMYLAVGGQITNRDVLRILSLYKLCDARANAAYSTAGRREPPGGGRRGQRTRAGLPDDVVGVEVESGRGADHSTPS
jgi:hypothetical protein